MEKMLESLVTMYRDMSMVYRVDRNTYKRALMLIGDILDLMDDTVSLEFKVYFEEIATHILDKNVEDKDEEYCKELKGDLIDSIVYEFYTLDDIIKILMIPRISPTEGVDTVFYNDALELADDFRKYLAKQSRVPARKRNKVYGYMSYIAGEILDKVEFFDIKLKDYDERLLIWMCEQIKKSDNFKDAYDKVDTLALLYPQRRKALYLKIVHNT